MNFNEVRLPSLWVILDGRETTNTSCAFAYCSGLVSVAFTLGSVTIGNSVTSIGYRAFAYCSGLVYVSFAGLEAPSYGSDVFYSSSGVSSVHVVSGYDSSSFCGKSVVRDYFPVSRVFSGLYFDTRLERRYVGYGLFFVSVCF